MWRSLADLPPLVVPDGFRLRHFEPNDAPAWAGLLARNAELGLWDLERAAPFFEPGAPMPLEGAFFVLADDVPVATAQLHLHLDDAYAPVAELGWVAAAPEACVAVLHHAAAAGHRAIFLRTDDHRLPAIKLYLALGFEPWHRDDPAAADRWAAARAALTRP
jgi:mycothiol synthase